MEAIMSIQDARREFRAQSLHTLHRGWTFPRSAQEEVARSNSAESAENTAPMVFVVEHELFIRRSLDLSCRVFGWKMRTFHSAQAFLESPTMVRPSCLVLDATMPELDVLDLQERVAIERPGMPIILITGTGGAPTTMQARPAGTVRLFAKTACHDLLTDAIASALERGRPAFDRWARTRDLRTRYESLSGRERQVMALVVSGRLNKQVGGELGISEITVKAHRGKTMRKMGAASLPSLVTMAARLGLASSDDGTC